MLPCPLVLAPGTTSPERAPLPFSTAVDVVVGSWGEKEASTLVGDAEQLWSACTEALRSSVPDSVWSSCFGSTEARSLIDDHLMFARIALVLVDDLTAVDAVLEQVVEGTHGDWSAAVSAPI